MAQQEALLDTPTILKMKEDLLQQQRELQARSLKITGAVEAMLILENKLKELQVAHNNDDDDDEDDEEVEEIEEDEDDDDDEEDDEDLEEEEEEDDAVSSSTSYN
jgi:type II secretory pathway component PulJ|tara:strand:+ start:118 stop:432 length:315 start_codon:yes stop_codon:yes gene_type:complete